MRFGWVGADAGYGSGPDFLFALADAGHTFLIDTHKSFVIYEVDPQPRVPESSSKGRKVSRLMTGQKSVSVEKFVESFSVEHWRVHNVRGKRLGAHSNFGCYAGACMCGTTRASRRALQRITSVRTDTAFLFAMA